MSDVPQEIARNYRLKGKFQYEVCISTFDGWDYKFPIVNSIRLANIAARLDTHEVPHAVSGNWLDVKVVPEQQRGYHAWVPTDAFILHMRPTISLPDDKYAYVGRFSYNPESKEFLMGRLDTAHADTINRFGSHSSRGFNKYVRGIYLKDKKLILIRAYFNPLDEQRVYHDEYEYNPELDTQKTDQTLEMLIRNNLPKGVQIITRVDNRTVKKFDPVHV
jgi:hypothetical protein